MKRCRCIFKFYQNGEGRDLNIEPSICILFYLDAKQPNVQQHRYEKVPCSCAPQHLMNNGLCYRSVGKDGGRNRKRRLERMYLRGGEKMGAVDG